jgi:hypothetical protein
MIICAFENTPSIPSFLDALFTVTDPTSVCSFLVPNGYAKI